MTNWAHLPRGTRLIVRKPFTATDMSRAVTFRVPKGSVLTIVSASATHISAMCEINGEMRSVAFGAEHFAKVEVASGSGETPSRRKLFRRDE